MAAGAGDVILKTKRKLLSSSAHGYIALNTICNFAGRHDNNIVSLMSAGAGELLRDVLMGHGDNAEVSRVGLLAFAALSRNEVHCSALLEANASDVVQAGLRERVKDSDILIRGFAVIGRLVACANIEHPFRVGEPGETVVQVMQNHPSDPGVAALGCKALANLARRDEDIAALMAIGAGDAVLMAMRLHSTCEGLVIKNGCCAVQNLGSKNEDNQRALALAGAFHIMH